MNLKNIIYFFMIVCSILLLSYLIKDKTITLFKHNIIVYNDNGELSEADINRVKRETENALNTIGSVLNIEGYHTIKVKIVKEGICDSFNDGMVLPVWNIKNKKATIFHEVTHFLTNHDNNRFFVEGLAVYFQEKYGEDRGFPNIEGIPFKKLLQQYKSQLFPISKLENSISPFIQNLDPEKLKIAYLVAGSFTTYLVDRYGEDKIKELNNSTHLNYRFVYGISLTELEQEWKDYYEIN